MQEHQDFSYFTRDMGDNVAAIDLAVEGIHCAGCMQTIEKGLAGEAGVRRARVNLGNRRVTVEWKKDQSSAQRIIQKLAEIGFRAYPFNVGKLEKDEVLEEKRLLMCLGVAGFGMMNIMLLSISVWAGHQSDLTTETRDFLHWLSGIIALPVGIYAGRPFFENAWRALRVGAVNMDVPISLGVSLALVISVIETLNHAEHAYFDSAIMLLFFLLIGRYLDRAMRRKTRSVASNLAALRAENVAKFISNEEIDLVPISALQIGDLVLTRVGDRIGVDGEVIEGRSDIDSSLVTGETLPQSVTIGDKVYAGTLNLTGSLKIKVTAADEGSLLTEVQNLLDKAQSNRSGYVVLADRAARLYAPMVHLTAALTLAGWLLYGLNWHDSIIIAITVLIITCPCALGLAVPAVQVVASGALFRHQVLLNSGDALERFAIIDTIVFDKTGTLTEPEAKILNPEECGAKELELAGQLALTSKHPLAMALARASGEKTAFNAIIERPGEGVEGVYEEQPIFLGRINAEDWEKSIYKNDAEARKRYPSASWIGLHYQGKITCFAIGQRLREDACEVMKTLDSMGYQLEILSGDHLLAVEEAANTLKIKTFSANLRPQDKIERLEVLRAEGHYVMMVGDGLNDAPALAAAHVSMSPIEATHLAQSAADAVFLGRRLAPIVQALKIGRKAKKIMIENLWLAVVYNVIAVPIAVIGWVTPLIAALAMSGSSIVVTLNALRAGKAK